MKQRGGAVAFLLLALILTVALAARITLRDTQGDTETTTWRSTTSAKPTGWKAFRTLLARQSIATGLLEVSAKDWPSSASVIITGSVAESFGETDWNKRDAQAALDWVEQGGTLIVFDPQSTALSDHFSLTDREQETEENRRPYFDKNQLAVRAHPFPLLDGVATVAVPDGVPWEALPEKCVPLLRLKSDEGGAVAVLSERGKGRILVTGSAACVDNTHLGKADNARYATALVRQFYRPGTTVLFDEFHQGNQNIETLWTVLGLPGQRAVLQLLLVFFLAAIVAGRRFGLPVPLPPTTRTSAEYVSSLARLLRRAGRTDVVFETLFLRFRGELCRLTDDAEGVADAILARHVAQRRASRDLEQRVRQFLTSGRAHLALSLRSRAQQERETLALVAQLDQLRKELRLGANPHP